MAALILAFVTLLAAPPGAPGAVLRPDVEPGFQRVIHAINDEGRLGPGWRVTGVSIDRTEASLSLIGPGAAEPVVAVLRAPSADSAGHPFAMDEVAALDAPRRAALLAVLDEAFPTSLWAAESGYRLEEAAFPRAVVLSLLAGLLALTVAASVVVLRRRPPGA